ncbi:hypothetical protein scyTo_0005846 [Scyliorhinus torazame]|uniref:ATP-citrate synthase n=1 Tax=Scyliorhinus torazame TaxID=75743 RepID=A0A401PDD9_SCYTO|nr:hypothetical protein [Scyliorhinus torazame]
MSAKAISEQTGKEFLYKFICTKPPIQNKFKYARLRPETDWDLLVQEHPWLQTERLVVKPDQLIKRRGKLGLVGVNLDLNGVKEWLKPRLGLETTVGRAKGVLKNFLIEPFVPHRQEEEFYVCIYAAREGDYVLFHHEGGIDVGDVDSKACKFLVEVDGKLGEQDVYNHLLQHVPENRKSILASFIVGLLTLYEELHFTYLEINPLVVTDAGVFVLDMAAKIDATADYICKSKWGDVDFPPPFGREAYPEEAYIADLDAKSGASLKLTILNPKGRIWTMVAGGGASVVYSDTICDLGGVNELANYGEYSGAPSEQQTYDYAKTILSLMTREQHSEGKILIIGGSIANFTNVAATFKGIVRAIKDYQTPLQNHNVSIFVRRGGPNYQEGLRVMGEVGKTTGIPIYVFGTETHMTAIVGMALGHRAIPDQPPMASHTANFLLNASGSPSTPAPSRTASFSDSKSEDTKRTSRSLKHTIPHEGRARQEKKRGKATTLFSRHTKSIIWGMQTRAVQGMLDFDYVCSRDEPSVAAMVYPFTGDHKQKFYWGHKEILIPVYKNMADALKKHPEVDVLINFASLRSAYDSTVETMSFSQIRTIAIIAEGIPEALTRRLIKMADEKGVTIIGPATVGGIKPGCYKIGNTGGMLDNILASKLYRPGSVAYVSRSGGMSNELNNIISRTTDGVYEGVAIGGDRYPGSTFMDHVLRYQDTPGVKMIVVLGEIGGTEEYKICTGIKEGRITKPVVIWCIGTCATMFASEVQFGHAGACANEKSETAIAKNQALRDIGAIVPRNFDELGEVIKNVYDDLVCKGVIAPAQEVPPPTVPMDYSWARGDRFGGALDAAAKQFSKAFDSSLIAMDFVNKMKKEGKLIMGIGHRVKSKPNLILNVDGFIGVAMVDLLRNCGAFTREEADEYVEIGALNGIFVLGRSMGFIGHYLDQKRLKQGLYRHPWDDISYVLPEHMTM